MRYEAILLDYEQCTRAVAADVRSAIAKAIRQDAKAKDEPLDGSDDEVVQFLSLAAPRVSGPEHMKWTRIPLHIKDLKVVWDRGRSESPIGVVRPLED